MAVWKFDFEWWAHARIAGAGLLVVAMAYVSLAVPWDVATVMAGVKQSLLSAGSYTQGASETFGNNRAIWSRPMAWADFAYSTIRYMMAAVCGAIVGVVALARNSVSRNEWFVVALVVVTGLLLLVRPYWHYGLLLAPPLSILSGIGVTQLVRAWWVENQHP